MDLTQRLRFTSAGQQRTATFLANTGNTNNYTAYAKSYPLDLYLDSPWGSYSNASASANYFTNGNPATVSSGGAVTGVASDTTFKTSYGSVFSNTATVSFDWVITFPSTTQFTITFSNVTNTGTFNWKMEVKLTPESSVSTTTGSDTLSNGAHTVNVGQTHSNGVNIYWARLTIEYVTISSVLLDTGSTMYVDSYDTANSYYFPLYSTATKSGYYFSNKNAFQYESQKLLFRFNTSSLGSSAIIMSATLNLYTSSVVNSNNPDVGVYISPSWPVTTYNATWYNTGNSLVTTKLLTNITNGGNTSFTVNSAYINKTGNTDCRLQLSSPPTPSGTYAENSFLINLNGASRPYLTILYR